MARHYTIIFLVQILLFFSTASSSQAYNLQNNQVIINISYANDTSTTHIIHAANNQKYTIFQKYSWTGDSPGRYNLQAYSIDNGPIVPIKRTSDGNFTLDLLADTDHSVFFIAKQQFEISLQGTANATFLPSSPTNDNWFDVGSNVQFVVPQTISSDKEHTRQQLDGWSLDNSDINVISRQESDTFKSPVIQMSEMHRVNLDYKTQYYITVISNFGRALGTGWYDSGTIVDITTLPGNDILVNHIFSGWQGPVIGNANQESTETFVDSPKVIVANWSADYTNISMIIIITIAVVVLLAIYQKRKTYTKHD